MIEKQVRTGQTFTYFAAQGTKVVTVTDPNGGAFGWHIAFIDDSGNLGSLHVNTWSAYTASGEIIPGDVNTMTTDLAERALCLGYTQDAAFSMADCWRNWNLVSDPCTKHPMHSTTTRDGYRVEGCEACEVIERTDTEGYYPGKWAAILADRETDFVKIMESHITESYTLGQCACDLIMELGAKRLPEGGRVCLVCGSVFTPEGTEASAEILAESGRIVATKSGQSTLSFETEASARLVTTCGTFALGETVKHAEMGEGEIVYLGSAGGIEVQFAGGNTVGVDEDHYGEWSQVRTNAPGSVPSDEAMAEAERDEMIEFNRAQAVARNQARDAMIAEGHRRVQAAKRDNMTGIDMIREAVTLTPVRTPKVATVHLGAFNDATACGRKITAKVSFSAVTTEVSCKTCKGTARFASMASRESRETAQAMWDRAGLRVGMVVRMISSGEFGRINELSDRICIGYWSGDPRSVYSRLEDFDRACQILTAEDFVIKGTRLASNLGGEAVVEEVGSAGIWAYVEGETAARVWTLSEFAAEISRGWLAVVPPVPTMPIHLAHSGHQVVSAFDLAEIGHQVTVAAGSPRNGVITQVSPWGALVRSNGGDLYWGLSLAEMVSGSIGIWR